MPTLYSSGEPGQQRIAYAFDLALRRHLAAMMPYYTLGYPDRQTSLEVIESIAPYSDLLELGIPFSDPIADGPTIQRSTQQALENGTSLASCLTMLEELRKRGLRTATLLMGYYNPILSYGERRFVQDAADAGADGFIVPDLPLEEASVLSRWSKEAGLALICFLTPTSNPSRLEQIRTKARGFVYVVSVTGVTGARNALSEQLPEVLRRVRSVVNIPVAVGFGISTPTQAAEIGRLADGVIVGSALINAVDAAENKPRAAAEFIKAMRSALRKSPLDPER